MGSSGIGRIAVVGAGLMGHGIAQEFAAAGYEVRLHDLSDELVGRAIENIRSNLGRLASLGRVRADEIDPTLEQITTTSALDEAVAGADLVVEAIVEDLPEKHALFRSIGPLCGPETIVASNTSSFMPSRLAETLLHPERLLVAHYFNPPYLVPLVEIVPGPSTAERVVATMIALLESLGKRPVLVRREATGFIANRLQLALFREALAIVESGIADPKAVDQAVKFGFGRRLAAAGPFEVFDLAGLDTILAVASQILPDLSQGREVPESLRHKIEKGSLGVKSGHGFHAWSPEQAEELRDRLTRALLHAENAASSNLLPAREKVPRSGG
jgi:3-hydroxybutyryl-CoA dehydrogenase